MALVWHMLRKDLRHSWIYLSTAFVLLLIGAATLFSALFSLWSLRIGGIAPSMIFGFLQAAGLSLFCGVLLLAEPLPGLQQYWLTRPIRWQQLLSAKVLIVVLSTVPPIVLVHAAVLMFRGFPLADHLPGIAWNALLLAAACFLPTALAACVSRNLQQLILWLLGLCGLFFALRQWSADASSATEWVVTEVTYLILLVGGGIIVTWQYATRQTGAGRAAVLLLIVVAGTVQRWPSPVRFALQHAASPVRVDANAAVWHADGARAKLHKSTPESAWTGSRLLEIPIQLEGLPDGWTAEWDGWNGIEVTVGGDKDPGSRTMQNPTISRKDQQSFVYLPISKDFINRHTGRLAHIVLGTELAQLPQFED